ncbi:MAG: endonuclease Q family protein [archaeon]
MLLFSDLHIHSKYSAACSQRMDLQGIASSARTKGLNLLGTGDFFHEKWLKELKENLKEVEGKGIFYFQKTFFILSNEISLVFEYLGKIRKVHVILLSPDFETVDSLKDRLKNYGNMDEDGRPTLSISIQEAYEICESINKDIGFIPAHAWTPWFGIFGSKSGFDSLQEAFGEKRISAIETGLSSDPEMNWRLSSLDNISLVSFSDAHSPENLGRELTVFEIKDYFDLIDSLNKKDNKRLLYTVEVDPAFGKYHWDGHRKCGVSLSPKDSKKYNNICPVCKKPLTLGVEHRVEELADREKGFIPKNAIPFKTILPLHEIIAAVLNVSSNSKKVWEIYFKLVNYFGSELKVLLEAREEDLEKVCEEKIGKQIIKIRERKFKVQPGYDGVYGKLLLEEDCPKSFKEQKTLSDFL